MVSGSCFVFLIVVFSLQSFTILCSMQAKGSFKVADGELLYANFFYFPGHKLWGTKPIESRTVSEDETCVAACIETSQCRSVNLKRVSSADGKSICHLLDTDKFRSSAGSFNESAQFDHYSLADPCGHDRCSNGGSCFPLYEKKDFKCTCPPGYKGRECNELYRNCDELLKSGVKKSGIYNIRSNLSEMFRVYCDQSNRGGGWTMVFKVVSGVQADIYQLWSSASSQNENNTESLNVGSSLKAHYKNRLVQNWQTWHLKEVRLALYKNGSEILSIVFNATESTRDSWFCRDRLIVSPWTDIKTEQQNFFSIPGHSGRNFYINRNWESCPNDSGWLMTTSNICDYERSLPITTVAYSKLATHTNWNEYENNVGLADVLLVYIR